MKLAADAFNQPEDKSVLYVQRPRSDSGSMRSERRMRSSHGSEVLQHRTPPATHQRVAIYRHSIRGWRNEQQQNQDADRFPDLRNYFVCSFPHEFGWSSGAEQDRGEGPARGQGQIGV